MLKHSFFIAFFLLFTSFAHSQKFEAAIISGITANQIDGDQQYGYDKLGVLGGVQILLPINEKLFIQLNSYFINKGAVKRNENTGIILFRSQLNYIEIPVLIGYTFYPKISIHAGIGTAYFIGAKLEENSLSIDINSYDFKKFDFQPIVGISYQISMRIGIETRFSYSFASIRTDFGWYNNNINMILFYNF